MSPFGESLLNQFTYHCCQYLYFNEKFQNSIFSKYNGVLCSIDLFQFDDGGEFTDDDAYGHGPVAFSSRFYSTWYYYMGLVSKFVFFY